MVPRRTKILDPMRLAGDSSPMNVEHIRSRLTGGFRPFAVVTASGSKYAVPHPEFIFVTPRTVVVADEQGYTTLLDPLHIVGLEDIPARKNGRTPRARKR